MKQDSIFIGNIKRCQNYCKYNKYGEEVFVGDFKTRTEIIGHLEKIVTVQKQNAILLKTKTGNFIDLDDINTVFELMQFTLLDQMKFDFEKIAIKERPQKDNDLFVDGLITYAKSDNEKQDLSVYQLKKKLKI